LKDNRELRKFGMVMAGALAVLTVLLVLRQFQSWRYTAGFSALFLLAGFLAPSVLRPLEWAWMKFAHALGFVMTNILLTVVFFTGVTLTGLVMRLLGRRPLNLNISREEESYWIDVDQDGPCRRPEKPY
jgi:hypothetical protein